MAVFPQHIQEVMFKWKVNKYFRHETVDYWYPHIRHISINSLEKYSLYTCKYLYIFRTFIDLHVKYLSISL